MGSESQYLLPAITLGSGIIRLDNAPVSSDSTQTHDLYNLSENLILYSTSSAAPNTLAPASICSYSEKTGRGFSNASDDLAAYFNTATGKSTNNTVSVIQVTAARRRDALGLTHPMGEAHLNREQLALAAAGLDLWENNLLTGEVTRKAMNTLSELGHVLRVTFQLNTWT